MSVVRTVLPPIEAEPPEAVIRAQIERYQEGAIQQNLVRFAYEHALAVQQYCDESGRALVHDGGFYEACAMPRGVAFELGAP